MSHMKEYLKLARITLCILTSFATVPTWATGGTMTGSGTDTDPFIIADAQDWATFASNISNSIDADKYYKLADDFNDFNNADNPVREMIRGEFNGHFDGNGKTIYVDIHNNEEDGAAALFSVIRGATIENLNMTGTITSCDSSAGLVANCYDDNSILNCNIATNLVNEWGMGYAGGIVYNARGTLTMNGCIYSGQISDFYDSAGGFVVGYEFNLDMNNCLFKGSFCGYDGQGTYHPIAFGRGTATLSNVYYLNTVQPTTDDHPQGADGIPVSETLIADIWEEPVVAVDGNTYYMPSNKIIEFADAEVKRICLEHWAQWDINRDGEFSRYEASLVADDLEDIFKGNTSITSFDELKNFIGITRIADRAFNSSRKLNSIDLSSCTSIGDYAFSDCSSLTSVDLSALNCIGEGAFNGSGIDFITLPGNTVVALTSSNNWGETLVFVPASLLSSYQSADNWKNIKDKIFAIGTQTEYDLTVVAQSNNSQLTSMIGSSKLGSVVSLKLSGTINSYDIMVMRNKMPNLQHLDLTDVSIVANTYQYYTGYHSENDVLGPYSFFEVSNLRTVKLPKSIKSIGSKAFTSSGIREVLIPGDALESVDAGAFENCNNLAIVNFNDCPNAQIGNGAFQNCHNLSKVTFTGDAPESIGMGAFSNSGYLAEVTFMGNAPTSIGDGAFQGNYADWYEGLSKVTFMGNAPVSIGSNAFEGNFGLTVVTFTGNSPVSIGSNAFANSGLKDISFPGNTLREIGSYAFYSCTSLPSLVIPEGVERIENNTFALCSGLRNITLPSTLRRIEDYAFYGAGLTSVIIPNDMEYIGGRAFSRCGSLASVKLSARLNSIGEYAFEGCTSLTELHIPSMISSIGDRAFEGCNNLLDVWTHHLVPQNIDQHTFSTYQTATLHVIKSSFDNYFWNTQWSQFLDLVEFEYKVLDSEYDIYKEVWLINNNTDLTVDDDTGVIDDTQDSVGQIEEGSALICKNESEDQEVGTIELDVNNEAAATLIENGNLSVDQMQFNIAVNGGQWYFFSFPFRISLDNINCEGEWLFRYYDSDARARGESGWQDLPAGTEWLEPGMGYIFQSNEGGTLIVTVNQKDLKLGGGDTQQALTAYGGQEAENSSWNFLGNPYTSYFNVGNTGYDCPVTVWNGSEYVTVEPGSDYYLRPFQAYFVQKPEDITAISFSADNRETYNQIQESAGAKPAFLRRAPKDPVVTKAQPTVIEHSSHRQMNTRRVNTMSSTFNPANPPEPTSTQSNVDMNRSIATAVTSVNVQEGNKTIYNTAGQRMNNSKRGVNIVRDQSGNTRKIMVK